MKSAENPTPTWLRSQQLDSASGETATSSNLGSPTRIQFLQIPYRLQDSQRFLKNLQYSSSQVAQLPVQWMPFPQYPLRSRMKILFLELQELQELQGNPGRPEEPIKEFHPQGSDSKSDISCTNILSSEREMLRYDTIGRTELIPSIVLSSDNTNYKNIIQLFLQLFDELSVYRDYH